MKGMIKHMEGKVVYNHQIKLQDLGGGVQRKVLAYNEGMMIVEVHFEEGSVGTVHSHPHLQNTYVLSGKFRFTIGDDVCEVAQGDTLAMPGSVAHGTLCLEKGVLIDIFAPMREDFI